MHHVVKQLTGLNPPNDFDGGHWPVIGIYNIYSPTGCITLHLPSPTASTLLLACQSWTRNNHTEVCKRVNYFLTKCLLT